jgi:hypothetical protein
MAMTEHLDIDLPPEHAKFLHDFAASQGFSISEAVNRLISLLARLKEEGGEAKTLSLLGILKENPSMWDYLSKKYQ